ncbi:unnamed protein product [Caenorhabditis bovis]|uniref:Uncharacterized protein n=1 Tax=Caenorhabditis bovis TaxID=2654633 RepID=A0A8S1FDX4_9PELO|nr:unnamed protein product [Caenorhabditis bovis]
MEKFYLDTTSSPTTDIPRGEEVFNFTQPQEDNYTSTTPPPGTCIVFTTVQPEDFNSTSEEFNITTGEFNTALEYNTTVELISSTEKLTTVEETTTTSEETTTESTTKSTTTEMLTTAIDETTTRRKASGGNPVKEAPKRMTHEEYLIFCAENPTECALGEDHNHQYPDLSNRIRARRSAVSRGPQIPISKRLVRTRN